MNKKSKGDFYKCKNQFDKIKEKKSKTIFVLKNDFFIDINFSENC
jgi:hypothetical protein